MQAEVMVEQNEPCYFERRLQAVQGMYVKNVQSLDQRKVSATGSKLRKPLDMLTELRDS